LVREAALGDLYLSWGRHTEAAVAYRKAIALLEKSPARISTDSRAQAALAECYLGLLPSLAKLPQSSEAEETYGKAIVLLDKFVAEPGDDAAFKKRIAGSLESLAGAFADAQQPDRAEQVLRKAVELRRNLADQFPDERAYAHELAFPYQRLGDILRSSRRYEEAAECYRTAVPLREEVFAQSPDNLGERANLAWCWFSLSAVLRSLGEEDEAAEALGKAVELDPDGNMPMPRFDTPALTQAALLLLANKPDEYQKACADMVQRFGQSGDPRQLCHAARACAIGPNGAPDPTVPVALAQQAVSMQPQSQWMIYTLGLAHYRAGQFEEAGQQFRDSLEKDPDWHARCLNLFGLAMVHHQLDETEKAQEWYAKAVEWMRLHPEELLQDRLDGRLLRREAEQLLGISDRNQEDSEATKEP